MLEVLIAMMPTGVEHWVSEAGPAATRRVLIAMMPTGVEHSGAAGHRAGLRRC